MSWVLYFFLSSKILMNDDNRSTTTKAYSNPWDGGKEPMMSILID